MESVSYQQRSNIRKARKRDPIVSVFMHKNPSRCYSISVPPSKSWTEFITKIRKQFQIQSDSAIALYQSPLDYSNDEQNLIDLTNLHQYDTDNTNMNKVKHKYVFCAKVMDSCTNTKQNGSKSKRSKKKSKKYRHNTTSDTESSSNESSTSSSTDSQGSESKNNHIVDVNERSFGLDLDIFDRLCTSKKPQSSKKNSKAVYHFHPTSVIQSLDFHLKETWLNLKTHPMTVKHIDDKYTIMSDPNNQFSLRTRRIIWPRNLQFMSNEFEYKLSDISSKWIWAILIVHGGRFAGAIYHGNQMILHKTLRRYVVRKKQGKRQVNHLSTSGVKSGSAGGYKRSWNEKKLLEEIREILSNWMDELGTQCDKIFVHCPGVYNKTTIYGNNEEQSYLYPQQNGALNEALSKERCMEIKNKNKNQNTNLFRLYKKDERIMQIPITTHGVTLKEVERVHYWLSTCWLSRNKTQI
eukprot:330140_1